MNSPPPFYRWRPHPWHGLEPGKHAPAVLNAYIEITPFDTIKYEIDKATGYLRVDRPQRGSAQPPTLYGFVPRTFCGNRVAGLSANGVEHADGDPLDICVISERPITRSEILLTARVIGGIQMVDDGEADDKIIAVLDNDPFWDATNSISDLPKALVERITHYFLTYKISPQSSIGTNTIEGRCHLAGVYDREHAHEVVRASMDDYQDAWGDPPPTLRF